MKLSQLFFLLGIVLFQSVVVAEQLKGETPVDHSSSLRPLSDDEYWQATDQCRSTSEEDKALLEKFYEQREMLGQLFPDDLERIAAFDKLFEEVYEKLSISGRLALSESYLKFKTENLIQEARNNPELSQALGRLERSVSAHAELREKGFFVSGKKLVESSKKVGRDIDFFLLTVQKSSLAEPIKQDMASAAHKAFSILLGKDGEKIGKVVNFWGGVAATSKGIRDSAIGALLIVGAAKMGGATLKPGVALIGANTTKLALYTKAAIVAAGAGAAGGAGYALIQGEAEVIVKSLASQGDFFCQVAVEQSQADKEILRRALQYSKAGAVLGGAYALGMAPGGLSAQVTTGVLSAASTGGAVVSVWGVGKHANEARKLYEQAQKASSAGEEAEARRYLELSRKKAVAAGFSGLEAVLASIAAIKTTSAFRQALRSPPESIVDKVFHQIYAEHSDVLNRPKSKWSQLSRLERDTLYAEMTASEKALLKKSYSKAEYFNNYDKRLRAFHDLQVKIAQDGVSSLSQQDKLNYMTDHQEILQVKKYFTALALKSDKATQRVLDAAFPASDKARNELADLRWNWAKKISGANKEVQQEAFDNLVPKEIQNKARSADVEFARFQVNGQDSESFRVAQTFRYKTPQGQNRYYLEEGDPDLVKFLMQNMGTDRKRVVTLVGTSGQGYDNEAQLVKEWTGFLNQIPQDQKSRYIVNIGGTSDGIGGAYKVAKDLGFRTTGVVSTRGAKYLGLDATKYVDELYIVKDSVYGGLKTEWPNADFANLSPTSQTMIGVSDDVYLWGGGDISVAEARVAATRGTLRSYVNWPINKEKALAKAGLEAGAFIETRSPASRFFDLGSSRNLGVKKPKAQYTFNELFNPSVDAYSDYGMPFETNVFREGYGYWSYENIPTTW